MRSSPTRRAAVSFTIACACVLFTALPARASSIPAGARIHVDRAIDLPAFTRTVASRYHIVLRRIVAADIDRDGDLDVLTTTDHGFLVWVNDGQGHLTSQTPTRVPVVDGQVSGPAWQGGEERRDSPIQNDVPASGAPTNYAHAPPAFAGCSHALGAEARPDLSRGCRVARAPPV